MKKFEITEQQIRQAYDAACEDWKRTIENWFPELYKRKSGWYKDTAEPNKWMVFRDYENEKIFGFDCNGNWIEYNDANKEREKTEYPAPESEVFERLKEEAIRMGYKEGVSCLFGSVKDLRVIRGNEFTYTPGVGLGLDNNLIFSESTCQWAEIISQPQQPDEYITVNNVKYKRCQ